MIDQFTNVHTADTIPYHLDSVTLAPESAEVDVVVPRDSEWSGFSREMAEILQELS